MGRRALPKRKADVEFQHLLTDLRTVQPPFSPGRWFANSTADVEIEVGSGKGLFLLNASERYPQRNFLGCEIAKKYARLCGLSIGAIPSA